MRLFALCILLASLPSHVVGQNSKVNPGKHTTDSQNATDTKNPISQIVIQTQPQQEPHDKKGSASEGIVQRFLAQPEVVSAVSTLMIFFATVAYVIISGCMLRRIGRQVVLTGVAARAARNSANALVNAERPWVVPRIKKVVKVIDTIFVDGPDAGKPCRKPVTYFTFSIKNYGRSPAEVIAIRGAHYPHLSYKGIDGGLTDPPHYGLETMYRQVVILAPKQRWAPIDVELNIWALTSMNELLQKEIESYKAHYIFYGVVLYRDFFNRAATHESRFC